MRFTRSLAALAVTVAAIAGTGTAAAETRPSLPAPGTQDSETAFWGERPADATVLVTPYRDGKPLRCLSRADHTSDCWQQRPDGQWTSLLSLGPVLVYPVWEDPASLLSFIPPLPDFSHLPSLLGSR